MTSISIRRLTTICIDFQVDDEYYLCLKNVSSSMMHVFFLLQLCHINKQWALDCESLAQKMSALEERIEQQNDRMGRLEEELSRQSTSTDEGNDPDLTNGTLSSGEFSCISPEHTLVEYSQSSFNLEHSLCTRFSHCKKADGTIEFVDFEEA